MLFSMTGFGRGYAENEMMKITLEIKTVNHRYTDFHIKMPKKFNVFEEDMKKVIKSKVDRGRVEVYIQVENYQANDYVVKPNFAVIDEYHGALSQVAGRYEISDKISLNLLTRFNDTLEIKTQEIDEEAVSELLMRALDNALDSLAGMRATEGVRMGEDVEKNLKLMVDVLSNIEDRAPEIVKVHQAKMMDRIKDLLEGHEIDEARILMEVAIFADKTNIEEEIVRLKAHIDHAREILSLDTPKGRKLDFLIQEMNREVNTIGSKSPDVDISNDVVELKSTLEKIREQIQNIE
ncbi:MULTISPECIES: YicC/YloC family endoribonuclease [unclassified Fusibacter]|uniref:YicC/YloC family endoribonuclease n=1 Tax=unclassified Fusibacter TaxID=2624464 RepID=UPI0010111DAE|nr:MULTISPECIES: YicC/YloC family endoribonuclease [unclassified Fusibacter]MCK8058046.1 YicC family protein [Fusibacter sp. A2]NPE20628.1 YicC family protein [Fusibacter sp. A1]RXV62835.1 YicC family protein [Fusibacter sp. A1]